MNDRQLKLSTSLLLALALFASPANISAVSAKKQAENKISASAKQGPKAIENLDDLKAWMTFYYLHPQPELTVQAINFADKENLFQGNSLAPLQAFFSRVFAQNPDKIKAIFSETKAVKDTSRSFILSAIWGSDSKEGGELLNTLANQLPEKAKNEFLKEISKKAPAPEAMPIDSPDVLDMLWACFSASGNEKYVKRIMTVLPGDKENKDLNKMLLASAAKWSLASNAEQHPKVMEICRTTESENPDLKVYMQEIIAKAEPAKKK
ncbi:MAG: hypothetical protein K2W82_08910 [Candidatus Obscuribacterales bacterium]|nr:hypothetical protein [Candidatus Obscuribacterales bacterium]